MLSVFALAVAAGAAICEPAPPVDDLPPDPATACAAADAPTPARVRPELAGACGALHRRVLTAAAREFDGDLDPVKGRLLGPLLKKPATERVLALWNQDTAGRAACERTPHVTLCDPEAREAWLPKLEAEDARVVARVRDLFTWYLQARKACLQANGGDAGAAKLFEAHRGRFSGELGRLLDVPADVERVKALREDYQSASLDVERLEAWEATLEEWSSPLAKLNAAKRASAAKGKPKARRKAAETALPD